ncbi:MAG: LPS export ABC transporter periplasmic protein LptC [Bacteroidetes bacterium]|nr:LPS export ABC transporter periplasmic protein LptC [Bacteroidota bacterium]
MLFNTRLTRFSLLILSAFFLLSVSCRKVSKKQIEKFRKETEDLSVERASNVKIRYTDSAILKATISTPKMIRYPNIKDPYTEMPKGLEARFYDENGLEDSHLSSQYGINYEKRKLIKLTDSVRVTNKKGERLESEELYWDQNKKTIYTNKFVRILRENDTIRGDGFESNETFSKYKITRPTGEFKVKEEISEDESQKNN